MSRRTSPLPTGWPKLRARVLRRDQHLCQLRYPGCTEYATEVDHIHGADDHSLDNLRAVCNPCHKHRTALQANAAKPKRKRPPQRHPGLNT